MAMRVEELEARVAELEAEVERLRAAAIVPVTGTIAVQFLAKDARAASLDEVVGAPLVNQPVAR